MQRRRQLLTQSTNICVVDYANIFHNEMIRFSEIILEDDLRDKLSIFIVLELIVARN